MNNDSTRHPGGRIRATANQGNKPVRDRNRRRFGALEVLEARTLLSAQPTTTAVVASAATAVYGQPMSFTATVSDLGAVTGTPTGGTVTFSDGATVLGAAPLVDGVATLSTRTLDAGRHAITASDSGDGNDFAPSASGTIATVAGGDGGPATSANLSDPSGMAVDSAGDVFFADSGHNRVLEAVKATGDIITVAGNGSAGFGGNNGPATDAMLSDPLGVALDSAGDLFIAEADRIREVIKSTGDIINVSGYDDAYPISGGPPGIIPIMFPHPRGVAVDAAGDVFVAEPANDRIREIVRATGDIITVAWNGQGSNGGDNGPATNANLYEPAGVAVDSAGDLFIADTGNFRIREVVKATGDVITVAGDGRSGYGGDNGPATDAMLQAPYGLTVDSAGDLFIADSGNNRIREVVKATGDIITVAGNGLSGYGGDNGPATNALLSSPSDVAVDSAGNLFITDTGNQRIREVVKATGDIITVASKGAGFGGDNGPATDAGIFGPSSIAVDAAGDLFIADTGNDRIREVTPAADVLITPAPLRITVDNKARIYGQTDPALSGTVTGILNGDAVSVSYATTATPFSDVQAGGYPIDVVGLAGAKAKDYSYDPAIARGAGVTPGVLTVTPAPLTVAVSSESKVYGQPNPALSGTVGGILNGDVVTVDYATTATQFSDVRPGGYPILVAGLAGAKAGDYSVDPAVAPGAGVAPGVLTVAPAPLTIAADNKTMVYGAPSPILTASYSGIVNGRTPDARSGLTLTTAPANSHVGNDPIVAAGASDPDYAITFLPGVLTITPAPLTITADNKAVAFGAATPPLTAHYAGFVDGDSPADLAVPLKLSAPQARDLPAGPYPIVASAASSPDYSISFIDGTLRVLPYVAPAKPAARRATAFVTTLYHQALRRGPEPAGLHYRLGRLAAHQPASKVARAVAHSREHRALLGSGRAVSIP